MTVHRLTAAVVALFCGSMLFAAACGVANTAVTTVTTATTATTETVRLYPVEVDGKWGFIDNTGTIKIAPAFETAYVDFSEGLAPVDPAGPPYRFGYIDTSGDMVIEPQFASAGQFSEGMAEVGDRDQGDGGKWGAIDTSGALVIPMQYDTPPIFSESLAAVWSADDWYFIDKMGTTVLGPFESAGNFSEGLAYVDWGDGRGFIDKDGHRVIELPEGLTSEDWPEKGFSEGLAVVWSREGETVLCGYIDTSGAMVIEPQFAWAGAFSEGLAPVATQVGGKWGYIDTKGDWVIEPQFDAVFPFSEGLATVVLLENYDGMSDFETNGYIDRTGTVVIPLQYSEASKFSGGIARVVFRDAQSGAPNYIDKTGKLIWPKK